MTTTQNPSRKAWVAIGAIQLLCVILLVNSTNELPMLSAATHARVERRSEGTPFDIAGSSPRLRPAPESLAGLAALMASIDVSSHVGETLCVSGYLMPLEATPHGSSRFLLMSDPPGCCFVAGAPVAVRVELADGRRFTQSPDLPVDVEGRIAKSASGEWGIAAERVESRF
jgi:hypothetical protein